MAFPEMKHITVKDRMLSTIIVFTIYFVVALSIQPASLLLYVGFCVIFIVALTKIQKHALMYINERRCAIKELEVKPDISPDDDSNEG